MDISFRAMRHKVRAPPSYTMFFKGVMTTEGLAKALLPEVDPLKAAQPFVEELGTKSMATRKSLQKSGPIIFSPMPT